MVIGSSSSVEINNYQCLLSRGARAGPGRSPNRSSKAPLLAAPPPVPRMPADGRAASAANGFAETSFRQVDAGGL
jgi:hypothetical protein